MLVPINITGGTYKHKSLKLSAQVTQNFWPQIQEDKSTKSPYVLEPFPGSLLFSAGAGSRDRGMLEHLGVLYKVTDTTLVSIDSDGARTTLGTIPGVARCIMVGINSSIVIVTEGVPYVWNGSVLTTVTDIDLETPNGAAHLNNQIIYDGDGGRFASSDVGDATSISGLNYATAESNADDLIRAYVHNQTLSLMGDKTIEDWWNSGVGQPPFDRLEGSIIPVGLGAIHSVANSIDFVYLLGHDRKIYAKNGATIKNITPGPLAREIAQYSLVSDAHGVCFDLDGQWMYRITFPTAMKTFIYPEGGEWFQLSSGTAGGNSTASSYAFAYGKHLIGDSTSGNVYEMDPDTYTENGETIVRIRDTGPLHGGLFGLPGKELEMTRFELIMETGAGLISGQGSEPEVMIRFSDDGGKTFSTEMRGQLGVMGEFQQKVEWFNLGRFESRIIRVQISDPIYCSIHSAAADIEPCI